MIGEKTSVEKQYGLNDYFQTVKSILGEKYIKVLDLAWGQSDTGRDNKFQTLILLEILIELKKLNNKKQ